VILFGLAASLVLAALAGPLQRRLGARLSALYACWSGATFLALVLFALPKVASGLPSAATAHAERYTWLPQLGVDLSFRLDGLGVLFALLVSGLGTVVFVYAGAYLKEHPRLARFLGILLVFETAMLGLVAAGDLVTALVFWEATSLTSFLLIGFEHHTEGSRDAALQALLVTAAGGLALLAGVILLGRVGGSFDFRELAAQAPVIRAHPQYPFILALIALGAFTKSAQFPFHFWLPNAMAAPTPVSAFLHSATLVKAGVFLLARLQGVLGGTSEWIGLLVTVGALTMLVGSLRAILETDLKRILAYSTITALGTLVALIGTSLPEAVAAALVFLGVHALYKGALFMIAGAVDHATGTRDLRELGGLARSEPWLAGAAVLAALSMAGVPPLVGFIGKELMYKAKLVFEGADWALLAIAVTANALTFVAAGMVVIGVFFGRAKSRRESSSRESGAHHSHRLAPALVAGPVLLAVLGVAFGLFPDLLGGPIGASAAAVLGTAHPVTLSLWYGLGPALWLSVLTVALGIAGYWGWRRAERPIARVRRRVSGHADQVFAAAVRGLLTTATGVTQAVMAGGLARHLAWIIAFWVVLMGIAVAGMIPDGGRIPAALTGVYADWLPNSWVPNVLAQGLLTLLMAAGTSVALFAASRLTALLAVGSTGVGVALLFLMLGAPDLALTQLLVETVFVVLAALMLRKLPEYHVWSRAGRPRRVVAAVLGASAGAALTAALLIAHSNAHDPGLEEWFARASVPEGKGHNIVNVILVDFRALDTLGEITVVATAALGVWALLSSGLSQQLAPGRSGRRSRDPLKGEELA
jgi:multicomponent Na+:H+ antiporter subunit A